MTASDDIVIHAVGDVFVNRPEPSEAFSLLDGVLGAADVVFGNCEVTFTRDEAQTRGGSLVADAASARGLTSAGFTVMSCANNHMLDRGTEGMFTTLEVLASEGIATAGAGATLDEARRPALLATRGGSTVAVLAYAAYYLRDTEATGERPGVVPVGAKTRTMPVTSSFFPEDLGPGVAPLVVSEPIEAHVEAMVQDIERAKRQADLVLTSFHWGDAMRPAVLTDHEHRTARVAIDAGADAVLGHHQHVPSGVETYRGKPIYYGLGHFVWDAPPGWADTFSPEMNELMRQFGKYGLRPRPGYPRLPFHPDCRMTMIGRCRFRGSELRWFGFLPCVINPDGLATPLDAESDDGRRVVEFVQGTCDDVFLPVTLVPDADERFGPYAGVRVVSTSGGHPKT